MTAADRRFTGGCLRGALRYEAVGAPRYMGHCYCADCRKASGGGFIPFMGFDADQLSFSGPTRTFTCRAASGGPSTRNFCPSCSSLVFGGIVGETDSHTIYAGSLDDPSAFPPQVQFGSEGRMAWFGDLCQLPDEGSTEETMAQHVAAIRASNHQHPDHDTESWPN